MPRNLAQEYLNRRKRAEEAKKKGEKRQADIIVERADKQIDNIINKANQTVGQYVPGVALRRLEKGTQGGYPQRTDTRRNLAQEYLNKAGSAAVEKAKAKAGQINSTAVKSAYKQVRKDARGKAERHVAVNTTAPLDFAEAGRYRAKFLSGRSVDKVQREYDTTRERAEEYRQKALHLRETGDAQREASSTTATGKDREDATRFGSSLTRSADQWDKLAQEESSKALELARELGYAKVYQVQKTEADIVRKPDFAEKSKPVEQNPGETKRPGDYEVDQSLSETYETNMPEIDIVQYRVNHNGQSPASAGTVHQEDAFMTDDERATFNYLYNTGRKDDALEYYNALSDMLEMRRGAQTAKDWDSTAARAVYNLGAGINRWVRGVGQLFTDEALPATSVDYAQGIINANASHGERILYSAANSIGNMLPMVAISAATQGIGGAVGLSAEAAQAAGKAAGVASMFAGAKGNAYTEAMQQGMTKAQASTYSTLVGASEAGLEYLIGGISRFSMGSGIGDFVQEAISGLGRGYARVAFRFAGSLIGGSIDEIIEENTQNYLEPLFINYVTGKEAEMPGWDEFIETTLSTLITTGVMESRGSFAEAKQNIAFTPFEAQLEWVSAAKNVFAEGTDVAEFADVLESRLQAGDPMSYKEFREGIRALGVDEKTMGRIAKGKLTVDEVLTSTENGDKISLKEWQAGQNSTAQQVQSQTQRAETVQAENNNVEDAMTAAEQEADRLIAEWNRGENSTYELGQQAQLVMQQLEEEVREGTATDPGSYMNRQIQLQEIVRSAPEASTAQQAAQNTTEGIDNNGRTEIFDDGAQRDAGLGTGEQAGAVAEGAGGPVTGGAGTQTQNGRADLSGGREAVSAREIGVKGGTAEKNIHVVIPSEIDTARAEDAALVEKMNRIVVEAAAKGQDVTFVSGALTVDSGGRTVRVEGVRQTGDNGRTQIYLQVDGRRDMERIYRHEDFHDAVEAQPGLLQRLADSLMQEYGREEMLRMAIDYAEAYDGIYGEFTEDMTEEQENELAVRYMEEVFADAYAGIRRGQRRIRSAQKTLENSGEIETLRTRGQTAQNAQEERSGKFSMSEPVERAGNLIAEHNLTQEKLERALEIGAFPAPSIAIVQAEQGHTEFGDYTVVFPAATIDPEADSRNRVYGADAWTPTSSDAVVESRVDADAKRAFEQEIRDLSNQVAGGVFRGSSTLSKAGVGGETTKTTKQIAEEIANYDEVKAAYLRENGEDIEVKFARKTYDLLGNDALERFVKNIGGIDELANIRARMYIGDEGSVAQEELERVREAVGEEYAERFAKILDRKPERKAERIKEYAENKVFNAVRAADFIKAAWEMETDGDGSRISRSAMEEELERKAPAEKVAAWVEGKLQDVLREKGVYNNEDRYTEAGDRKSFEDTHWELSAENIVKAMAQAADRGGNFLSASERTLLATAAPEFRNIDEIHADEGRLQTLDEDDYHEMLQGLYNEIVAVADSIQPDSIDDGFVHTQGVISALTETAKGGAGLQNIREGMEEAGYSVDRATAMQIQDLFLKAKEFPTSYFEAKPQRVVGFDEAVALLAPASAPADLMERAEDAGLRVIRYTGQEDRVRVANELPGVKFSVEEEQDAGEGQQDTQKDLGELNRQVQGAEAATRSDALKAQAEAELQEYLKKGKSELAQSISKMSDAALKKQTERVKQAMTAESEGLRINEAAEAVTEGVQKYAESRNQRLGDMLQMIKAEQNKRAAEKRAAEKQRRAEARKTPEAKLQRQIDKLQKQIDIERAALRQAKQGGTLTSEMAEQSEERITGLRQEILDYKNELQEKKTAAREEKKRQQDQAAKEAIQKEKPRQATRDLTNALIESFNVPEANRTQATIQIRELAEQAYQEGQKGPITNELRNKMLDTLIELGTEREVLDNRESEISQRLREKWIQVPDEVRTAFGEEWADIKESAYDSGIYFTYKDGYRSIQSWTAELQKEFGQMFDTTRSPQQQLRDIVNLASEGYGKQMTIGDMIRQNADDYSWSMREKVEELGKVLDDQLQRFGEKANIEVKLAARSAKSLQAQQQYFENRLRSRTEQQMESLAREKLLKSAKQLSRMANKSSAEQRAAIQKVIGNIDLVARSITPDGIENLQELALSYRQAMEAMGENFIRDKDVEARLARLDKKRIDNMDDMDDVRQLAQDITAVATQIRNQNQMLATVRRETVSEMAENVRKEVKAAKGSNAGKARDFVLMQTDAKRFFLELGGWKEDGATAELLHGLERGEEKRRLYEMRAQGLFNGFLADKTNKKWVESATGKDAQWITVDTPRGASVIKDGTASAINELTMTQMMRVSLIMHSRNEDNLRHIAEGGMRVPNRALYKKGNISEAYARGDVVTLTPQAVRDIVRGATAQEIQFAAILSKYFDGQAKNAINEVSMIMDGYEKAMVKNYFPIESDRAFTVQDNDQVRNDISLTGLGFLKQRTGKGANPVLLQDASQTFQRSVESVSKYYGLALPIRDLNAVMNSTYYENAGKVRLSQTDKLLGRDRSKEGGGAIRTQSAESVRNVIAGKWGKSSINYIEKLVGDLQRSGKDMDAFSGFFGWLRGQYASAVISFNPSSMLKQWGSYATAMAYLSPGDLAAGLLRGMKGRVNTDTLGQYSSVYWYRNQGNATQELHDLTTNEALVTKLPLGYNWAQAMDSFITRRLMLACERNVSRTTGLTPGTSEEINSGTDAYWTKVATLFNKVVLDTQSNSSILERAAVARANPNNISRFMTMFRADAFQSFNLLREGQGKYQTARAAYLQNKTAENRRAMIAARKQLARSGAAVIASQFVSASISVMINALRRRDELWDEDGLNWGEVMKQLGLGMVEGLAGISIAGEELVGLVESIAFDETWYGPDVNALQLLTDTAESAISAAKILKNGKWELAPGALKDLALEASTVMGMPLKNVEKYVQVLPRWIAPELMAEYDNIWDEVDRNALSKSSVLDIKADIGVLLDNRTEDMSDEDKEELTRLYLAGGTGALPAAVPNSIKYTDDNGEEVTEQLDYSQKQTYKKEWSKIVSGAIGSLLKSDLYNEADDKTKTKMLNNLYTYANGLSAEKVVPEKTADGWIDDARTLSGEGVKIADYIQWHTMLSEMDSDDASGTSRTGLKNARALELANEKGWTWAVPSDAPDELKWMEDDTEQTLQLTDAQKKQYRKTWTGIVYGSVGNLMQSDEYQNGTEKERGALIQKLTSYASALAAYEIEPKKVPDTWISGGQQAVKDGVPLDEYIVFRALYSELDSINEDGDEESGLKNKRTLDLIESMGWSDKAEQSAYINTVASESKATEAEALQKAGMTWEQANDVLAVPGTGVAKKAAVTATNASEATKAKVLASYDKSEKQKTAKLVMTGLKYGIPMRRYTDVLQNADADGSGNVSQEEAGKYIATLGLSVQEAAYLWQMVTNGKEGKKNPFSSYFGSEFYSAAGAFD